MNSNIINILKVLLAATVVLSVLFFACRSILKKYLRIFCTIDNALSKSLYTGTVLSGCAILLTGFFIIFRQLFVWLKNGEWRDMSLLKGVLYTDIDPIVSWLTHPQSWFGVHTIIHWVLISFPLSLFLIIVGFVIANTELTDGKKFTKRDGNGLE